MTDLSYKPRQEEPKQEPIGLLILALLPFAVGFWALLEMAL